MLRRSSFKRPVIERKPWAPTPVAPEHRRGAMVPVGTPSKMAYFKAVDTEEIGHLYRPPKTRDQATRGHLDRLFAHGCIACRLLYGTHVDPHIHHPREFAGGGEKADDWLAIPLCEPHHTGNGGVHGDRAVLRQLGYTSEAPLLAITLRRIYG